MRYFYSIILPSDRLGEFSKNPAWLKREHIDHWEIYYKYIGITVFLGPKPKNLDLFKNDENPTTLRHPWSYG